MNKQVDWVSSVADKMDKPKNNLLKRLQKHDITIFSAPPEPKRFSIQNIQFSGIKNFEGEESKFKFTWDNLDTGAWAILSYENHVGKTGLMGIILWALRGKVSDKVLTNTVKNWIHKVCLEFKINENHYRVDFSTVPRLNGTLELLGKYPRTLNSFSSADDFKATMNEFMMPMFNLESIPYAQNGKPTEHKWASYASAFFIGYKGDCLLGDVKFGGLTGRLLQMFVGLPYARTKMSLTTAENSLKFQKKQKENAKKKNTNQEKINAITNEIHHLEKELQKMQQDENGVKKLLNLNKDQKILGKNIFQYQRNMAALNNEIENIESAKIEDQKEQIQIKESIAAEDFFSRLTPKSCPRCSHKISKENIEKEKKEIVCSVCGSEPSENHKERHLARLKELNNSIELLEKAFKSNNKKFRLISHRHESDTAKLRDIEQRINELNAKGSTVEQQIQIREKIATLNGEINVLSTFEKKLEISDELEKDLSIINKSLKEVTSRLNVHKESFLDCLNIEIKELASKFGMRGIESVAIDLGAKLTITIGGTESHFSDLQPGQKLRLRIATVIALLRIAKHSGVGCYPGLLIVDSPGAEETCSEDLSNLINELVKISQEIESLQLFVTSAEAQKIQPFFDAEHCLIIPEGEYLV